MESVFSVQLQGVQSERWLTGLEEVQECPGMSRYVQECSGMSSSTFILILLKPVEAEIDVMYAYFFMHILWLLLQT